MSNLYEPEESVLSIKYKPNNEIVSENPPRFTWVPSSEMDKDYVLEISTDKDFKDKEKTFVYDDVNYNFYTPNNCFEPNKFYWRYKIANSDNYSKTREFTITSDSVKTPIKNKKQRYESTDNSHPRIFMNQADIKKFQENLKINKSFATFNIFYEESIKPAMINDFPEEPLPYPNNVRVIHLWRSNYITCQNAFENIRSLCVGGLILNDDTIINKAKENVMKIANWDVFGPTSRDYNDECSFRVAGALAFGFDWLYDYLSDEERLFVLDKLYVRTKQVADHVIINSRIHSSLYDSHAVRSLSSVLTPCCLAMLNYNDDAKIWLDYSIDYFNTIYTPWGEEDGGWAEGPMYWTTGMAYLIEALNIIKKYFDINIFKRPFFKNTGDFILNAYPHDTLRASFSDQSSLGKKPGIKTAFNIREFAKLNNNGKYQWYFNRVLERESTKDDSFYNKGWWDFNFDDMLYKLDAVEIAEVAPCNDTKVNWFKGIGWVSINKNMANEDEHIFVLTKSSQFGSVSHSHGDQNSFLLHAFGEPLLSRSGYYVGFNSSMHRDWRRQTKSHNTLLIDGVGQYAEMDKIKQLAAKGKIIDVIQKDNYICIKEDATAAYKENVDYLKLFTREIYFVDETYLVIVDNVELEKDGQVDYLLHSLNKFNITDNNFDAKGKKAKITGSFSYVSSGINSITESNEFDGVNELEIVGLEKDSHLKMTTKKAKVHTIVTTILPSKIDDSNYISKIKDDQGHDIFIYFTNNGKSFTLSINGNNRYN